MNHVNMIVTSRLRTSISNLLLGIVTMKSDVTANRLSAILWMLAVVCSWAALLSARSVDATSEKRLITMLLENYRQNGVDGRPVLNTSATLPVAISFSLIQILQFDPVANVITLVGWTSLRWRDVLLRWNSYEFDNIRQVVLRPDQIWTPDIVLFNAISPPRTIHDTRLIVAQNGDILWTTHAQHQLTCSPAAGSSDPIQPSPSVPPAAWPRGGGGYYGGPGSSAVPAECQLRFGSWTMSADLIRLQSNDQPSTFSSMTPVSGDGSSAVLQPRGRLLPSSLSAGNVPASLVPGPTFARDRSSTTSSQQTVVVTGDSYVPNADWDLNSMTAVNHEVEYPCCPGRRYADVTYSFRLVRRYSATMYRGYGQGPRDVRSRDGAQETLATSTGRRNVGRGDGRSGNELAGSERSDSWPDTEMEPRFAASSSVAINSWRPHKACWIIVIPAMIHLRFLI